jgi:hypothetical protein
MEPAPTTSPSLPTASPSASVPAPLVRVLQGAAAGVLATGVMSGFMLAAGRAGLIARQPPRRITERLLFRSGLLPSRRTRRWASVAAHFGFGASAGAVFAAAVPARSSRLARAALGTAYGALVWLVSYAGWLPAARLMPPPTRDRPARQAAMLVAHLIFGSTLGVASGGGARGNAADGPPRPTAPTGADVTPGG